MKTTETALPELSTAMVADGMRFHDQLDDQANPVLGVGFDLHLVQGQKQQTAHHGPPVRRAGHPLAGHRGPG